LNIFCSLVEFNASKNTSHMCRLRNASDQLRKNKMTSKIKKEQQKGAICKCGK